jgi:predicted nucleic acid-binding protein
VSVVYLDASAALKLIFAETESAALKASIEQANVISSALLRTEVLRSARRADPSRVADAREVLRSITLLEIDDDILERAASLDPSPMRTLDAIHLATAVAIADELEALITYDRRMIEGAKLIGLPVASPR